MTNKQKLAEAIRRWGTQAAYDPNRWHRDPIGQAIRDVVSSLGNWRNAPRGNPRKGQEAMRQKQWERNQ